jgi:hypothetical protein
MADKQMSAEDKQKAAREAWQSLKPEIFKLYHEKFVPTLDRGLWKGVMNLDEKSRHIVIKEVATACTEFVRGMHKDQDGLVFPKGTATLEEALNFLCTTTPHRRTYKIVGDTIYFTTHMKETYDECICPLVVVGAIDKKDAAKGLCECSVEFFRQMIEYMTGKPLGEGGKPIKTMCMGDSYTCDMTLKLSPTPKSLGQKK